MCVIIHGHKVKGNVIDFETRCTHYHKEIDRIAIKFYCCNIYYPCFECHKEHGCDNPKVWPKELFNHKAILCGGCGNELTINEYYACNSTCPVCFAAFNPGCSLHKEFYFEV
ncbi:CHY zinc finger protein [Heyndrickxia sporothermodurans]|uniref:CHY zinc finger protein n=1 Tax=Heyndrickxia sporothermodurans TaxID=46224 RepID=UPI0008255E71|nr:CHY zinc finger protein [Heyndrickxia sporothermodurans]MED3650343.1 CHY zinc finger protein [Heyndrickxia sporothermodurans]MED3698655.1 CHY zinc finger protein [Heyndrickxia sporothermodurans]